MDTTNEIHVIEPVGNGNGQVQPSNITVDDIVVTLTRSLPSKPNTDEYTESIWLTNPVLDEYAGVREPDTDSDTPHDAVIVIAGAPIPSAFADSAPTDIDITVSVRQVTEAETAVCPECKNDLRETFHNGGCTVCGFYYDSDGLDPSRQSELDALQENYDP